MEDQTKEVISSVLSLTGTIAVGAATGGLPLAAFEAGQKAGAEATAVCHEFILATIEDRKTKEEELNNLKKISKNLDDQIEIAKLAISNYSAKVPELQNSLITLKELKRKNEEDKKLLKKKIEKIRKTLTHTGYHNFEPDWLDTKPKSFLLRQYYPLPDKVLEGWFVDNALKAKDRGEIEKATGAHVALALHEPAKRPAVDALPDPIYAEMKFNDEGKTNGLYFREPIEGDIFVCPEACDGNALTITASIFEARKAEENVSATAESDQTAAALAQRLNEAKSKLAYKGRYAIPQAGTILWLDLVNRPFENNSVALSFGEDGRVTKFSFGEKGSLAPALASASDSSGKILETIGGIKSSDLQKLTFENKKLEAKKNKLELLKEIKALEDEANSATD